MFQMRKWIEVKRYTLAQRFHVSTVINYWSRKYDVNISIFSTTRSKIRHCTQHAIRPSQREQYRLTFAVKSCCTISCLWQSPVFTPCKSSCLTWTTAGGARCVAAGSSAARSGDECVVQFAAVSALLGISACRQPHTAAVVARKVSCLSYILTNSEPETV